MLDFQYFAEVLSFWNLSCNMESLQMFLECVPHLSSNSKYEYRVPIWFRKHFQQIFLKLIFKHWFLNRTKIEIITLIKACNFNCFFTFYIFLLSNPVDRLKMAHFFCHKLKRRGSETWESILKRVAKWDVRGHNFCEKAPNILSNWRKKSSL